MPIDTSVIRYAAPPFISGLILLALGIFTLSRNRKALPNQYFFCFSAASAVWLCGFAFMNIMQEEKNAFTFSRILYTAVILMPSFYLGFVIHFLNKPERKKILWISYIISLLFILSLWLSRSFLSGNIHYVWGYSSKAAWIHDYFMLYFLSVFLLVLWDLWLATNQPPQKDPQMAIRAKYTFFSVLIALLAASDFLSVYGVGYYPLGFIFMIIFFCITVYAIVKHRLMDIQIALKKGFLHSLIFSALAILFITTTLLANWLSVIYLGSISFKFSFLMSFLVAMLFIPFHNYLYEQLHRLIFRVTPREISDQHGKLLNEVGKQEKLRSIATLAAGMAHEIKNPLATIKTFAEHLPLKYSDPDFRDKFSRLVSDEVDRINNIVRQLLEFSKPQPPIFQKVLISDAFRETLSLLNSNLLKNKVELKLDINSSPLILGDKNQLKQAFLNLFLNAIQSMPSGGVLTVKSALLPDGYLRISIQDEGCGISHEDLPRVFEPFFSRKDDGTGLGLPISRGIIEAHGGRIWVESQEGRGTQVVIELRTLSSR